MQVKKYVPISPTIEVFHKCDAQVRAIVGPVGTGKTTAALWEIAFNRPRAIYLDYGIDHTRWVVVRKTFEQLMDTDFQEAMDWFIQGEWRPSKKRLTIRWPGSKNCPASLTVELIFHSCNSPEEEGKFRSMNLTGCWIDEANQLDVITKNIIKGRLGRFPKRKETPGDFTPRYMVETSNPFPPDHPMYTTYDWMGPKVIRQGLPQLRCTICDARFIVPIDSAPLCPKCGGLGERTGNLDWRSGEYDTDHMERKQPRGPVPMGTPVKDHIGFWQEPGENEENLTPGYWAKIAADYQEAPEMTRILVEGKAGMQPRGKPVYRNFIPEVHVARGALMWSQTRDPYSGLIKGVPLLCGWDTSGDFPACVLGQRVGPMSFQILREFYDDRMGIVDFGNAFRAKVAEWYPGAEMVNYGDPAGSNQFSNPSGGLTSNVQILREQCDLIINASRQELDVRISAVDGLLLRRDGLLFDPQCSMLINGFTAGYVREENPRVGLKEYKADPLKNRYSHLHDALQYLIVMVAYAGLREPRPDIEEEQAMIAAQNMGGVPWHRSGSYERDDYGDKDFDPREW